MRFDAEGTSAVWAIGVPLGACVVVFGLVAGLPGIAVGLVLVGVFVGLQLDTLRIESTAGTHHLRPIERAAFLAGLAERTPHLKRVGDGLEPA